MEDPAKLILAREHQEKQRRKAQQKLEVKKAIKKDEQRRRDEQYRNRPTYSSQNTNNNNNNNRQQSLSLPTIPTPVHGNLNYVTTTGYQTYQVWVVGSPHQIHHQHPPPVSNVNVNNVVMLQPGSCPNCHTGRMETEFGILAILLAIIFFPWGIFCCLAMQSKRCSQCQWRSGSNC